MTETRLLRLDRSTQSGVGVVLHSRLDPVAGELAQEAHRRVVHATAWLHEALEVRGSAGQVEARFPTMGAALSAAVATQRTIAACAERRAGRWIAPRIALDAGDVAPAPLVAASLAAIAGRGEILVPDEALGADAQWVVGPRELAYVAPVDAAIAVRVVAWTSSPGDAVAPDLVFGFDPRRDAVSQRLLRARIA